MQSPVTGHRTGATTAVRCIDVAALMAAAILRRNPTARGAAVRGVGRATLRLSPRDSVMTNAERLAAVGGGGTRVSAPLAQLNRRKAKGDLVIYRLGQRVVGRRGGRGAARRRCASGTRSARATRRRGWCCIDLQPYATTQATEREDILNVGGFSDQVFDVVAAFAAGRLHGDHWVGAIESVEL